ncbi:MAG TPA: hypothetical protein VMB81_24335 [Candidatus Sulfotelmatobacter sp.]|nr:hypothetical protein [Candidatus Sulfotelmatobacter sp.]
MSSEVTAVDTRNQTPALEAHQSFLVYRRFLHLKLAAALVAVASLAYLIDAPRNGSNGGTWLGYTLGTIGALIIVWLTWFGWRKRSYGQARVSLNAWLSAHVYFGLSLIVIATLHCAFEFGYNVHTLSYALMMLVIASGLFGIFAYTRYPKLMTLNRMGATQIQMLGQIASLDGEIRQAIIDMDDAIVKLVLPAIQRDEIGGSMWRQLSGRYRDCPTAEALRRVDGYARGLRSYQLAEVRAVLVLLTRKAELLERMRRDIQYKALMDIWLYIHVPLTFALLAALAAHIFAVFFYW